MKDEAPARKSRARSQPRRGRSPPKARKFQKTSNPPAAQPRSFHKFAFDCLQATRVGWTRTDQGGQGDCGYRVLCCGLAKILATVILPEKLAS